MNWLKKLFNRNSAPDKITTLPRAYERAVEERLVPKENRDGYRHLIMRPGGVSLVAEQYKDTAHYDVYAEFKYVHVLKRGGKSIHLSGSQDHNRYKCHTNLPYLDMMHIMQEYDEKAAIEATPEDLRAHQNRVEDYQKENVDIKRDKHNVQRVHKRQIKKRKFNH